MFARLIARLTGVGLAMLLLCGSLTSAQAQECCDNCPDHVKYWDQWEGPYGRTCDNDLPCGTCCSCPPQGPYFGYNDTCWKRWPSDYERCPVGDWENSIYRLPVCGGPCGDGCCGDCGCCCTKPVWTAGVDVLALHRDIDTDDRVLVYDCATLDELLCTCDFDFDTEIGPRVTISRSADECTKCEFVFWSINNWNDSFVLVDPESELTVAGLEDTDNYVCAQRIAVDYDSDAYNLEANHWWKKTCHTSCLLGVRYFRLDEEFNINSYITGEFSTDYNVQTSNDLIGLQTGFDQNYSYCCDRLCLGVIGKAGVYANIIEKSDRLEDVCGCEGEPVRTLRDTEESDTELAFLGELDFYSKYSITECWAIRGGYQLLLLEGVALAPNNLALSTAPGASNFIDDNGSVFFHGAYAGVEFTW